MTEEQLAAGVPGNILPEKTDTGAGLTVDDKAVAATNNNLETDYMEVHHHPELPHKGEKKNFKEYFLEFVMIFLAVTMGFIAENIRERLSDNEKEKYYIESLIKNLKDDTATIKTVIDANIAQIKGIDSLQAVTKNNVSDIKVQDSLFYYTTMYLLYDNDFKNNDITLVQLRNAGGYRVIKNNAVLDSIAVYETSLSNMQSQFKFVENDLVKTRDIALEIFDMSLGRKFATPTQNIPVLTTSDKEKISTFYNKCWLTVVGLRGYTNMLTAHKKYLTSFIGFLQKEYNMD